MIFLNCHICFTDLTIRTGFIEKLLNTYGQKTPTVLPKRIFFRSFDIIFKFLSLTQLLFFFLFLSSNRHGCFFALTYVSSIFHFWCFPFIVTARNAKTTWCFFLVETWKFAFFFVIELVHISIFGDGISLLWNNRIFHFAYLRTTFTIQDFLFGDHLICQQAPITRTCEIICFRRVFRVCAVRNEIRFFIYVTWMFFQHFVLFFFCQNDWLSTVTQTKWTHSRIQIYFFIFCFDK